MISYKLNNKIIFYLNQPIAECDNRVAFCCASIISNEQENGEVGAKRREKRREGLRIRHRSLKYLGKIDFYITLLCTQSNLILSCGQLSKD